MNHHHENAFDTRNTPRKRTGALKALGLVALLAVSSSLAAQPNDPVINLVETGSSTWNASYYSPCTEELIYFEVDQSWSVAEAFLNTPGRSVAHSIFNTQLHGVGIGEESGDEYLFNETYHRVWNNNGGFTDGPVNEGERDHFSVIAVGSGDNVNFHMNVLCVTTPDADYWLDCHVELESVTFQCRG